MTTPIATLDLGRQRYAVHRARRTDLPALVRLLRDDPLGRTREGSDVGPYETAFESVDRDPAHLLVAVRDADDAVVATLQLTLLPGLSRGGATRLQVEGVRVHADVRGAGLGAALLTWAAAWGREQGATLAQLTTDERRPDARRFYERLGWVATHTGMKLPLA
ncbi:GNAT family N-acetyltransferase [Nocardioides sp. AX2bis]|uniref:GNAT family N-acetyltransferase n=1 Tax=Nocardioides sp. AX2bis TaxID=2653157 RepID=UPI0012F0C1B6|nr:GNAT family N-acetyltransferase [Nocardioides sp. AX2bis]VXA97010.1 Transcriptional regulator [Nocardioides sp. AX2bis]